MVVIVVKVVLPPPILVPPLLLLVLLAKSHKTETQTQTIYRYSKYFTTATGTTNKLAGLGWQTDRYLYRLTYKGNT